MPETLRANPEAIRASDEEAAKREEWNEEVQEAMSKLENSRIVEALRLLDNHTKRELDATLAARGIYYGHMNLCEGEDAAELLRALQGLKLAGSKPQREEAYEKITDIIQKNLA